MENNRGRAVERVIVILHKPREQQVLKLSASLSLEGITCRVYRDLPSGEGFRDEKDSAFGFGEDVSRMNTVIITDDRGAAARLSAGGFICIGCEDEEGQCGISGFFEGAALVTDTLETLDADILEECLLRGTDVYKRQSQRNRVCDGTRCRTESYSVRPSGRTYLCICKYLSRFYECSIKERKWRGN